jgi:hypothetical protein
MYGGQCTEPFSHSKDRTVLELERVGLGWDWLTEKNESLVHRARMEMTATFLRRKEFTHLFWIDADMDWEPEGVAAAWNLQTDIAVGLYSMKRPDMPLSAWKDGKLVRIEDCPKEPFEVDYAGTGFMLISRKAIESVIEWLRQRHERCKRFVETIRRDFVVTEDELPFLVGMLDHFAPDWEGANGQRVPALFMTPIHNDGLESEDYHFSRIAREAGFKTIADPSIKLGHWGMTRYGAQ